MIITSIALEKLTVSPHNVRKSRSKSSFPDLKASICYAASVRAVLLRNRTLCVSIASSRNHGYLFCLSPSVGEGRSERRYAYAIRS